MFTPGFVETVSREAWRSERERPAIVVMWQGQPKIRDVVTLSQALLPGQVLRVAADAHWMLAEVKAICKGRRYTLVGVNEDRVLTRHGCYAHYYADIQRRGVSE